jgi:hypothetical protein
VATGTHPDQQQAVCRYPEKGRAAFLKHLVEKENITHVLWQYSPYAMHPRGTPWWVLQAMRALRKTGVQQSVYFHEVQIRYSVPGWLNTLRAFQQHTIANRALRICGKGATSIAFYLQYFNAYITANKQNDTAEAAKPSSAFSAENLRLSAVKKTVKQQSDTAEAAKPSSAFFAKILSLFAVKKNTEAKNMHLIPVPPNIPTKHHSSIKGGGSGETGSGGSTEGSMPATLTDFLTLLGLHPPQSSSFSTTSGEVGGGAIGGDALFPPRGLARGGGEGLPFVRIHKPLRLVAFTNRALPSVVQALAPVQKQFSTIKIVWLGHAAPQDITALEHQCTGLGLKARITGTQPLDVLATEIEQADIVLLPQPLGIKGEGGISLKNGTLAAAMAAGKAIIATRGDMTGTALLNPSNLLHLVADNDAATWQHAITHLLKDEPYRRLLGQNARAFYEEHLCWEVVGEKFLELMG